MREIQFKLATAILDTIKETWPLERKEIIFSIPPNRKFGDLSTTIPFVLAKKVGEKPFVIGNKIIEMLKGKLENINSITLANGGFINFTFDKEYLYQHLLNKTGQNNSPSDRKIVVEHTSINPNKSAHIGHLRNSCLGDTLVRSIEHLGHEVEIQNYLDDTGVQVADVVWGAIHYKKYTLEDLKKVPDLAAYLWDLYIEVNKMFKEDEALVEEKKEVHKKIEDKVNPEYEISDYISKEVLRNHIAVMEELDIRYDLLVKESDIIELDFFKEAARILEDKGIMYDSEDPEKKGCKVIKYRKENIEKIIVRSNGTVTYIGKDIAYTMWKTGYFSKDFYYTHFMKYDDGKEIYITEDIPNSDKYEFGGGEKVFNVIDTRQSYLQNIISQILEDLSPESEKRFAHFSYEMVALTPACVKEMGFELSEEAAKKSYVEVSGRKGIAVKAEDLIAMLRSKSLSEVEKRHPDLDKEDAEKTANAIAIGALRYFMIKFNANTVIAFDFADALSFEGDTGPYLQYSVVRINSIMKKLNMNTPDLKESDLSILDEKEFAIVYEILLHLSLIDLQVQFALDSNELSAISNYTYTLCQKFNNYYHNYTIISEENECLKELRIQIIWMIRDRLLKLFRIMGIPVPERM